MGYVRIEAGGRPTEAEQRAALAEHGVDVSGNFDGVWMDRVARNQSKAQRWEGRDALVKRMSYDDRPTRLVVTHLHLLGSGVQDIADTLSAIARPGNELTVTSVGRTFDLSTTDAPELALRIAEAPSAKARAKAAAMRAKVKRKTPRMLAPADEAEIKRLRASDPKTWTLAALAGKFDASVATITRTLKDR